MNVQHVTFLIADFIPIVQILINGGPSSIETVCQAVNRKTPIIVIQVREKICHARIYQSDHISYILGYWQGSGFNCY